jgi:hypothetical protein
MAMHRRERYLLFVAFLTVVLFVLFQQGALDSTRPSPSNYTPEAYQTIIEPSEPPESHEDVTSPMDGSFTTIPHGANTNGFTVFDNLYLRDGTFYVITSEPSSFPPRREMISKPMNMGPDADLEPTDQVRGGISGICGLEILPLIGAAISAPRGGTKGVG